ncbi:MAG: GNAT family N-acetyltransferase [Acidobacteria bacterium]|nr:GNAT family N-acetyltransferase [Acidobacteriota bacterium]
MSPPFALEPLNPGHDRAVFSCGQEALDRYLRMQASQDAKRRMAACFVAVEAATGRIAGYYTLSSAGIPVTELPSDVTKKLPRYPSIPAVRIGRLAVDLGFRGRGLGGALLADALRRVLDSAPATFALLVDAKDESAVAFYRHHGFLVLASQARTMFLPISVARRTLL